MPESEDPKKVSNNDLRNAQFGGGFINAENVNAQRIGGDIWNFFLGQQLAPVGNPQREHNQRLLLADVKQEVTARLRQSLHNAVLINLGKESQPQQVKRPWDAEIKIGEKPPEPLADTTSILEVFDDSAIAGKLLILGAPGSGKTTTQLELAQALVSRAEEQPDYPVPVLFNLSSWKDDRQSLVDWLVAELKSKYGVSKKLSQELVDNRQLLPLLDGLDELEPQRQELCVYAINQFLIGENKSLYLVVCSRIEEYSSYSSNLHLSGAISLRELNEAQILKYFEAAGRVDFWQTLQCDEALLKLVITPLFLSITALSVQNLSIEDWQQLETMEKRIEHLFDAYWQQQMFNREPSKEFYLIKHRLRFFLDKYIRRLPVKHDIEPYIQHKPPNPKQTKLWLIWLAQQMKVESKTEFLIEEMQPYWLKNNTQKFIYYFIVWGVVYWLTYGLMYGLMYGLISGLIYGQIYGQIYGLISGLILGLVFGLISGLVSGQKIYNQVSKQISDLISGLVSGLIYGLILGVFYGLSVGLTSGVISVVIAGLVSGLISGLIGDKIQTVENLKFSIKNFFNALILGLICGLFLGIVPGVIYGLTTKLISGLILWLTTGLIIGLISGFFFGISGQEIERKIIPNQGIYQSFFNTFIISVVTCLLATPLLFFIIPKAIQSKINVEQNLIYSLVWGLFLGIFYGISRSGISAIKHFVLRVILWFNGYAPWNYARFLDYCANRLFLQRVGGRYRFIHKMLQDHFAQMPLDRIVD